LIYYKYKGLGGAHAFPFG